MIPSGIEYVTGITGRHVIDAHDGTTYGRLNGGFGWTLQIPLVTELMQVTFTDPMLISGVILQCRPVGDLGSIINCVTSVLIKLGNDSNAMEYITYDTGMPKIFHVNHQAIYAYDIISFESVTAAKLIEIQPLTSSSDTDIRMRFEILTCEDANGLLTLPTFIPAVQTLLSSL
ncbi:uncharacterized protein [Amphiura filiformis]|uniref:uncharacterized protein n=1 Tax=Amphiura filiformis TaxID=82378 RepID=UPI003B225BE2